MVGDRAEQGRAVAALAASEARFRALVEHSADGLVLVDALGVITYSGPSTHRLLGYADSAILGRELLGYIHPEDQAAAQASGVTAVPPEDSVTSEVRVRHHDRSWRWLEITTTNLLTETGINAYVVNFRDITARRAAAEDTARLAAIVTSSEDPIIGQSLDGVITSWNAGAERLYGYQAGAALGRRLGDFLSPPDLSEEGTTLLNAIAAGESVNRLETVRQHFDGTRIEVMVSISPIRDAHGRVTGAATIDRDITDRKRLERQLIQQAFHDSLTGLPNRALFLDRLAHALMRTPRQPGRVALLSLDLDRFKLVNDTLGHAVGDRLLVAVGERLQACLRPGDTLARFSGDEFAVLLEDLRQPTEASRVATRMIDALRPPFPIGGREVFITSSIGIAFRHASAISSVEELLRQADIALYQSKANPTGEPVIFSPHLDAAAALRLGLETDLRRALSQEEFHLFYQPVVDLTTGSVSGVEALLRWRHPNRSELGPASFIPVAEDTGLIVAIGRWVLAEACREVMRWQQNPEAQPLKLFVNISAREFQEPDLVAHIANTLTATGLPPQQLCLELTETAVMEDVDQAINTLTTLKGLGIALSLDDFGTGYSSLGYLSRFPMDVLKVDRSFVAALPDDIGAEAIVRAIIALAHTLGLAVTAEGVETAAQLLHMQALGCQHVQGFYFAPPVSAGEVPALLGPARFRALLAG